MKKSSLMGASVVAAALLAAAPVVAPVASLATPATQEVKADTTGDVASKVKAMSTDTTLTKADNDNYGTFNNFFKQFGHIERLGNSEFYAAPHAFATAASNDNPFFVDNANNAIRVSDSFTSRYGYPVSNFLRYFFNGQQQVNLISTENTEAAQRMYYTLRFDYSNAINNVSYQITTLADADRARSDMNLNGGKVTMSLQLYDANKHSLGDAGLMKSSVSLADDTNSAAFVKYTQTLNAKVNDSAETYGLNNSFVNAGGSIINSAGKDITQDAYNNNAIRVGQLRFTNLNLPNPIVDGNFVGEGDYYQHIVIDLNRLNLKGGVDGALARGDIRVNGEVPSTQNVDANTYVASFDGTVDGINYSAGSLILKRLVKVGPANLATKDEKVNGVVTVNTSDITTAPLYDESGKIIADRSLPNKSRWQTDIKRTVYANGQVFYRVSTHEYIKADQVTFTANDASNSSDSTIKGDVVVTPSEGVFTMDNLGALLWSKSDDNNSMTVIADRYLPGQSAWRADKKAVVNGNTFYRVSTNEWVKADKGTFVAK